MLYAGIDEAGYGPMLGPLCVALTVFEAPGCGGVRADDAPSAVPDLWAALSEGVCREARQAGSTRVAVNDSKRLKGSNSLKTRHPLMHLERGVLGFVHALHPDEGATNDAALLRAIGAANKDGADEALEWYRGDPVALPVSTTPDHLQLIGGRLRAVCERAGVRVLDVSARMLDERAFNDRLRDAASKAEVSLGLVGRLIRRVWRSERAVVAGADHSACVVVDRQSGRMRYAPMLREFVPEATIRVVRESEEESVYALAARDDAGVRREVSVSFRVEAERWHFPVALASMTAKYVRELSMLRFNRFWCGRYSELKPTAGYVADARRWLADLQMLSGVSESSLREMCRRA